MKQSASMTSRDAEAAKKSRRRMKTKTLVKTLTSFRMIPSGEGQEDFGGDLLPEAIVIKNILEGMHSSLETLMRLKSLLLATTGEDAQASLEERLALVPEEVRLDDRVTERLLRLRSQLSGYIASEDYARQKRNPSAVTFVLGGDDDDADDEEDKEEGVEDDVFTKKPVKKKEMRKAEKRKR